MAANRELLDAFNESVDRLSLGQPIETLLSHYPVRIAAQLRPMLESAQVAHRASVYPVREVNAARERARAKVLLALQHAPPIPVRMPDKKVVRFPARRLLTAAAAVMLTVLGIVTLNTYTPTPAYSETLTPMTAGLTSTPTPTPTGSPSPSVTPTPSTSPTSVDGTVSPLGCAVSAPDDWVSYFVKSGDTLSALALNTGATLAQAQTVNCITDPRLMRVGQEIFLPRKPTITTTGSTPAAPATLSGGGGGTTGGGGETVSPTEDNGDDGDDDDDSGGEDDDGSEDDDMTDDGSEDDDVIDDGG